MRPVAPKERQAVERLARLQTAPARQVQRARIIAAMLEDRPRSRRPRTHDEEMRSRFIVLVLRKPSKAGLPFALWTLECLQDAFFEREGAHLSDSAIWTWMDEEGFKWERQESWFHGAEKRDPEFAQKRGR